MQPMTLEVAVINRLLPAEMLGRVFRLLPHADLKNAVLVCRWWSEVGGNAAALELGPCQGGLC